MCGEDSYLYGGLCHSCGDPSKIKLALTIASACGVFLLCAFLLWFLKPDFSRKKEQALSESSKTGDDASSTSESLSRLSGATSLKIIVSFLQIFTAMSAAFPDIDWPASFSNLLYMFEIINVNLLSSEFES